MYKISTNNDQHFFAKENDTILAAGLDAGFSLPYSCKTGRCSSCKSKVIQGDTIALAVEEGLTEEERKEGWVLGCVRSPLSDIEIQVEDLNGIVLPTQKILPCRIQSLEKISKDVMHVNLRVPPNSKFDFYAGQYINIIGPNNIRRSYSIASAPKQTKTIELHIKKVTGGLLSEYWFEKAKENDLLRLAGPSGTFFMRETKGLDIVFLATGTGIAPIKSILEDLSSIPADEKPRSISLFWGGRYQQDLYFSPSFKNIGLKYFPVLSRECSGWTGGVGYVQNVFQKIVTDLTNTVVYACGSDAMIKAARVELIQQGLDSNKFYSDAFVCSA